MSQVFIRPSDRRIFRFRKNPPFRPRPNRINVTSTLAIADLRIGKRLSSDGNSIEDFPISDITPDQSNTLRRIGKVYIALTEQMNPMEWQVQERNTNTYNAIISAIRNWLYHNTYAITYMVRDGVANLQGFTVAQRVINVDHYNNLLIYHNDTTQENAIQSLYEIFRTNSARRSQWAGFAITQNTAVKMDIFRPNNTTKNLTGGNNNFRLDSGQNVVFPNSFNPRRPHES